MKWLYLLLLPNKKDFNTMNYKEYEKLLHRLCYNENYISYDFYVYACRRYLYIQEANT